MAAFDLVLAWEAFKDWLSATFHITHWSLHLLLGLLLLPVFAKLLRRPITSFVPILPIAFLEALNEISDFTRYYVSGWPWTWGATSIEIALTLVPPTLVVLLARAVHVRRPVTE